MYFRADNHIEIMKNTIFILFVVAFNIQLVAQCWDTVSVGERHSVAIKTDGTLWAWGDNTDGQIGDGTEIEKSYPVQIGTDNTWSQISAGQLYTMAIKTDGTLWGWGRNLDGQLGDGTFSSKQFPVQIGNETNWKLVSAGEIHTLAIKMDSTLWSWGGNSYGELGDGSNLNQIEPIQIGTDTWKFIAAGYNYSIAIKSDGTLWGWGNNADGQLGDGTNINKNIPVQISVDTDWCSVAVGFHTLILKIDGTLWGTGDNTLGQLGIGSIVSVNTLIQIGTEIDWKSVSVGLGFSILLNEDGTLWGMGGNSNGQLMNYMDNWPVVNPVSVDFGNNWSLISCNKYDGLAININNDLIGWGYNGHGQSGDGETPVSCTSGGISISELSKNSTVFSVFPNPVKDVVSIQTNDGSVIDKIEIIDLAGRIYTEKEGDFNQINIEKLPKGMYLLFVYIDDTVYREKIMKQ